MTHNQAKLLKSKFKKRHMSDLDTLPFTHYLGAKMQVSFAHVKEILKYFSK